ncbi:7-deoxyloganetin glucosyltransferase [Linum grandiflorum]
MGSNDDVKTVPPSPDRPHAVCVPFPAQSHIKATLKFAKLLRERGFSITFVNTEFNHKRFLHTKGPHALDSQPDFRFTTIPDGLPLSDPGATQSVSAMCGSAMNFMLGPFRELVHRLNEPDVMSEDGWPPVSCIIADGMMPFPLVVAKEIGVPSLSYWTFPACAFMGFKQYRSLYDQGITPFKDESYMTNGALETPIQVPGMKNMRLRDLPDFFQTTDPNEPLLQNLITGTDAVDIASALVIHTYDAFEADVLAAINELYPGRVYTIGPMQHLLNQIKQQTPLAIDSITYSLWEEEPECLRWLDSKPPNSVIYVNFGSIAIMSKQHLVEFGMGLVNSEVNFLWVIRPDLVIGESTSFPPEFVKKAEKTGFISGWCPQEEVLNHSAVGGFLTHCGWGSIIETVTAGVPVLCWPFFADQPTNCKFSVMDWEIGMEIGKDVKREEVEGLVRELMNGKKGEKMREKALEWARLAQEATGPGGSSTVGLDRLVNDVLLKKPVVVV